MTPIREYICSCGLSLERIELSDQAPPICKCGRECKRVEFSKTAEPKFYGEGFYKPSRKD